MITPRRRLLGALVMLVMLAGCQSTEVAVQPRTLDQAKENVVGLVDAVVAGAQVPLVEEPPQQRGCLGDLGSYHGPPFRWEYSQRAEYTDDDARHAKSVVDEMVATGWTVKVRDRAQAAETNYALSDGSGVILSVTIPDSAVQTSLNGAPNTIRVTGTSECAG